MKLLITLVTATVLADSAWIKQTATLKKEHDIPDAVIAASVPIEVKIGDQGTITLSNSDAASDVLSLIMSRGQSVTGTHGYRYNHLTGQLETGLESNRVSSPEVIADLVSDGWSVETTTDETKVLYTYPADIAQTWFDENKGSLGVGQDETLTGIYVVVPSDVDTLVNTDYVWEIWVKTSGNTYQSNNWSLRSLKTLLRNSSLSNLTPVTTAALPAVATTIEAI